MRHLSFAAALIVIGVLDGSSSGWQDGPSMSSPPVLEESIASELPDFATDDVSAFSIQPETAAGSNCGCSHCRSGPAGSRPSLSGPGNCPPAILSEGWCRRPWYWGLFAGALSGNDLQEDLLSQQTSFAGGLRLGRDLDLAWAVEARLLFSDIELADRLSAQPRTADLILGDISLVHHFGQHPRIQPFLALGIGVADWEFVDAGGNEFTDTQLACPIGLGVKQRYDDWLVFRFDLTDNIIFGGGTLVGTQHEVAATGSIEFRFGGSRTSYWPWRPRLYFW